MYAIVTTGGKQYKVCENDIITVEKLNAKVGDKINLDVLMLVDDNKVTNGNPLVKTAEVVAEVVEQGKEEKDSIEDTIEPFLIQQGFINKTPRGRIITQKAYRHLNIEYKPIDDGLL